MINNRTWVLIHNGIIFESSLLKNHENMINKNTDSEKIIHYIIDKVNEFENEKG